MGKDELLVRYRIQRVGVRNGPGPGGDKALQFPLDCRVGLFSDFRQMLTIVNFLTIGKKIADIGK